MRIFTTRAQHHMVNPHVSFGQQFNKSVLIHDQLVQDCIISSNDLIASPPVSKEDVLLVHDVEYVNKFYNNQFSESEKKKIGLLFSPFLHDRVTHVVGGTVAAAFYAKETNSCSAVIGGGSHHAFSNYGSGYCIFNDLVIAPESLKSKKLIDNYLIIDLDVHHGDGTAQICASKKHAYTFSIHSEKNYVNGKIAASNWDIALPVGTGDHIYLDVLEKSLETLRQRRFHLLNFDIIMYQAGVDVLAADRFGRLKLSLEGVQQRDEMVFQFAKQCKVPIVATMGGGYPNGSVESIQKVVRAHCNTIQMMKKIFF